MLRRPSSATRLLAVGLTAGCTLLLSSCALVVQTPGGRSQVFGFVAMTMESQAQSLPAISPPASMGGNVDALRLRTIGTLVYFGRERTVFTIGLADDLYLSATANTCMAIGNFDGLPTPISPLDGPQFIRILTLGDKP